MYTSFDIKATVPVHYETMDINVPLVLYRVFFGDTTEFASLFRTNAIIDAELFDDRVIITDSRSFTLGKEDPFFKFLSTLPGTCTILDFADKMPTEDVSRFILGYTKYSKHMDAMLRRAVEGVIEDTLKARNWTQAADSVKALLFMFETSFIVADFECRFVVPDSEYFDTRFYLFELAVKNSNDLLLQFSGKQFQMYGNLSSTALYIGKLFWENIRASVMEYCYAKEKTSSILELFEQTTAGIDHQNDVIIPSIQIQVFEL